MPETRLIDLLNKHHQEETRQDQVGDLKIHNQEGMEDECSSWQEGRDKEEGIALDKPWAGITPVPKGLTERLLSCRSHASQKPEAYRMPNITKLSPKVPNHFFASTLLIRTSYTGKRVLSCYFMIASAKLKRGEKLAKLVVDDYPNVFPDELPGLLPIREIELRINFVLGTQQISIRPYRMAPAKLTELNVQLKDLFAKGFIQESTSPWEASILFAKKHDGSL
ncbi:unnamed protein product [Prunus armeniaca]